MHLKKLNLQAANSVTPTQLDFLRIISLRGSDYFREEKMKCKNIEAGYEGEQKVIRYIREYGSSHWIILQNVWMKDYDKFECDIILLTSQIIYIIEVKNYTGTLTYDNGKCYYDSIETRQNPFEQLRKNLVSLRKICAPISQKIAIKGAIIFAGKDHEVQIKSSVEDLHVVTSNGIRNFILQIAREEQTNSNNSLNSNDIIKVLNKYEIAHPYPPTPLTFDEMREIQPGIYCVNCQSYHVDINKSEVHCLCGQIESREEAILRTICDYGVLNYKSELTLKHLFPFFNKQLARSSLNKYLAKHFTHCKNSSYSYYINTRLPYEKIRHQFQIDKQRVLYLKNGDSIVH